jgi:hypothetical protein
VIFSTGWLAVNPRQLVAGLIEKEAICGIAVGKTKDRHMFYWNPWPLQPEWKKANIERD